MRAGTDAGGGSQMMDRNTELAARLERGDYEIDAGRVAEAMLRRRGRGLLMLVPKDVEFGAPRGPDDEPTPGLSAA